MPEVDRPDRSARRRRGKSDPIDAEAAARAVLAETALGTPKARDGKIEMIRALRVARRSALKARPQAANQLHDLVVAALSRCVAAYGVWRSAPWSIGRLDFAWGADHAMRGHQAGHAGAGPPLADLDC